MCLYDRMTAKQLEAALLDAEQNGEFGIADSIALYMLAEDLLPDEPEAFEIYDSDSAAFVPLFYEECAA